MAILGSSKKKLLSRGFTLVEVIVSVGIITILSASLLVYSRRSEKQILLNVEKGKISQTILRAKDLALSGYTKPISNPPPCSYGFRVDSANGTYSIFEYTPPAPDTCDTILGSVSISTTTPNYREIEKEKLNAALEFDPLFANKLGFVIFIPPDPKVMVFNEDKSLYSGPASALVVPVKIKGSNENPAQIKVNKITGYLSFQ